jgi:hypothetical protein
MKRKLATVVIVSVAACLLVGPVTSAPQPSEASPSWDLDFTFENPKPIVLKVPGSDTPQRFWFMRYKVINRTGQDINFTPEFLLYTDTGQLLRAGRGVPSMVFERIKKIYNAPLLKTQAAMIGKLLQGADNAKQGVAIWPDFDKNAGSFDVFVSGLSGETVRVKLPVPIEYEEDGEKKTKEQLILTKTRKLTYDVSGEAASRKADSIRLKNKKWVMR